MPKETFFTAISRWRVVLRRALDASGFWQGQPQSAGRARQRPRRCSFISGDPDPARDTVLQNRDTGLTPVSWRGESLGLGSLALRHVILRFVAFFGSAPGGAILPSRPAH